jgi:hypothetical protein
MQLELQIAGSVDEYENKANGKKKVKHEKNKKTCHREISLPFNMHLVPV